MAVVNKEIDKGGGSVEVGYSFNGTGCEGTIVSGRSSVTWLTVVANPTKNKLVISAPPNDGNERSGVIQVTVNGTDCPNNKIQVTQGEGEEYEISCVRGTDNGEDIVNNKEYSYPLFVCGEGGHTGDSIVVHSLMYKNPTTGEWTDLPTTQETATYLSSNPDEQWVKVYRTTSGGRCGEGGMQYTYERNDTGRMRTMRFELRTTSDTTSIDTTTGKPYESQGHTNPCSAWTVTFKQCRPGYYWCIASNERSADEIPCGTQCSEGKRPECDENCGGGDDFTVNGSSTDFSTTIDSCNGGGYNISISKDASFEINPNTNSVKINNGTEGNLNAGTYTITYDALSEGAEEQNTITFTHNGNTIVMTLIRTCNVVHDCTDCKSIFPDDDKLRYIGKESNFETYELIPVIDGAGGDENEVIVRVLSTHCNASFARSVDSPWIKNGNDGIQVWVMCDGEYNCVRFNLQENPDAEAREGSVFIQWWNGDNENPIYQSCYRIKVKQGGKHSQTCNCSIIASGGGYPDEEHAAPFTGITNALGRFTSSCSVDDITPTVVDNVSWISDLSLSFYQGVFTVNGTIARNDGDKRNAYISLSTEDGQCGDLIPVYQKGYSCSFRITQTQYPSSNPAATHIGSPGPIGTCQTDCDVSTITTESDCFNNWVHDISFSQILSVDGTYFVIATIEDNTEDARDCTITFKNSKGDTYDTLKVYQKGNSSTQCDCGTVSGRLNIGATATGGVLLGSFNGSNDCSASDYKVVKDSEETIVNIANTTINKSGSIYRIYANITNTNTSTSPRTQTLLVQKVSDGQMCGGPFVIEQQGTTPLCVVDLIVSRDSTVDCGVHFKIKEMCSSIGTYDVIEWGCSTNNTPVFDQSAFGAIVASGDGITQNASVDSTTFTNYHIWWRNRQAPAVSGTTVIQLKKCEHTPTKFSATVRIDQVEDSSMSPNSIDWGDGSVITELEKGAEYIHMYNDDTQDYTCTVFGNRIYTMNKDNHHVTICDCVALPEINPYVFFGNTSSSKSIDVNPNGCSSMYWVKEASQTWCTAQFEENDTKLKLTASSNSSGNIRSAAFLVGIRAGSSAQDAHICQWIYAKQGDTANCNTVYTEMNGKTAYFNNYSGAQTILTNCKYANMKDIDLTSDVIYDEYEDYGENTWAWSDWVDYGKNWITGCTWSPTGGLEIGVTYNGSSFPTTVARHATIKVTLVGENVNCAIISVYQDCTGCSSAGSRDAGSNDEG